MLWLSKYLKNNALVQSFVTSNDPLAHLSPTQEALLILGFFHVKGKPLLVIKDNEFKASQLVDVLNRLNQELRVVYYNHEESLRVETITQSDIMHASRIQALYSIVRNDFDVCVTHAVASLRKLSKPEVLNNAILDIKVGQEMSPDKLIKKLHEMGYTRVKYVDKPFTYSIRGGVCDVFSIQMSHPLRIEFFDIEIESLRYFDIDTQRSVQSVQESTISFANDVLLSVEERNLIHSKAKDFLSKRSENFRDNIELKLDMLHQGQYDSTMYPFLGYLDSLGSIFDYISDDISIILSSEEAIKRNIDSHIMDIQNFREEMDKMETMIVPDNLYINFDEVLKNRKFIKRIQEFQSERESYVPWHAPNVISQSLEDTVRWLNNESNTNTILISLDDRNMHELKKVFDSLNSTYRIFEGVFDGPGIYLTHDILEQGFILEDAKIQVYTTFELFQHKRRRFRYDDKFSKAEVLTHLNDLSNGDYVVHRQHGIGRYLGITTKEIDNIHKDFIRIQYKDNDELFVPLEQFSLVRKFLSAEGTGVRLSKLGSSAWSKNKARVEANVAVIADKLIELYAKRMESAGFAFSPDSEYQKEFEAEFPFELTPDQKLAIKEIKEDMESLKPMDRLLIGDVGFGKTEVAIRAAFKAFVDKKQVIFLCPTTILSAQHYRTFQERFSNYPIVVEVLNRFTSEKNQKDIIRRFKEGRVDILVGTHRVLSKDVKPKDLGLLIIDEEQRFGVEHKESIKEIKVSVDVLSLSATPIPRTLQMSLIGLRSLSQLNTPPSNRLPVMTYVIEKNNQMVYDIINKELSRGGQVFYLFNNVDQIYTVANNLSNKVKAANVAVVHGQMDRYEIEDVMFRFISREINVLVCTTIIETGIDIPNANTILVDNAHRFGLSQLYQIKGRVGRSDRLAYAYFLVPNKKSLTEVASKRLQAIKEFTQLGSGYKIAMRDLTIRGAGELLGGNQSGFIDTVGIDLYVQLLKEAIMRRKGLDVDTDIIEDQSIINVDGYLPEGFASDDGEKLEIYHHIQGIETFEDLRLFYEAIHDRYGSLPNAVQMLLEKKRFELILKDSRFESFKERLKRIELVFSQDFSEKIDGFALFETVSSVSKEIQIKYQNKRITLVLPNENGWIQDLLQIIDKLKEKE